MAPSHYNKSNAEEDILDMSQMKLENFSPADIPILPNGTTLDLSNNCLTYLPTHLSTLMHIVQLDLSRNSIQKLPETFGQLKNLKHLDLYSNQLQDLPLSFANLKSLKWLDLKHNPLNQELQNVIGPCNTPYECALCAKKVINLIETKQLKLELELKKATGGEEDDDDDIVFIEERQVDKVVEEIVISEDEEREDGNASFSTRNRDLRKRLNVIKVESYSDAGLDTDQLYEEDGFVFLKDSENISKRNTESLLLTKDKRYSNPRKSKDSRKNSRRCRFWTLLFLGILLFLLGCGIVYLYLSTDGHLERLDTFLEDFFPHMKKIQLSDKLMRLFEWLERRNVMARIISCIVSLFDN